MEAGYIVEKVLELKQASRRSRAQKERAASGEMEFERYIRHRNVQVDVALMDM